MKFHLGFVKFSQWYGPNNFNKLEVNESIMKDYLTKGLLMCLDQNKKDLKDKLNTMNDFQIVSKICVKERLSLYNFLLESEINSKDAKNYINKFYMKTFRNKIYVPDFNKEIKNVEVDSLMYVYNKVKTNI
jgi:hypothetical protein